MIEATLVFILLEAVALIGILALDFMDRKGADELEIIAGILAILLIAFAITTELFGLL